MPKYDTSVSECTLLANILDGSFNEDTLAITSKVSPDDFLDNRNKAIYKAVMSLTAKNEKIDLISVIDELKNLKLLDLAGGEDYIQHIAITFVATSNINSSIDSVLDRSLLAQFVTKLKNICDETTSKSITTNIGEYLAEKEAQILEISKRRRIADFTKMDSVTGNIVAHLVSQSENRKTRDSSIPRYVEGIPTGYEALDKITLGWQKGDMIVVGARPSVGKTAFALNLAYNVCKRGIPVLFFSLEMNDIRIGLRLLSRVSKLKQMDLSNLDLAKTSTDKKIVVDVANDADAQIHALNLERGLQELRSLNFYLDCNTDLGIMDIVSKCNKFKSQVPDLGLIVIDYLSLIRDPSSGKENRNQEVAAISKQLKSLANSLQVPIIVLSQLNRESDKTKGAPQMSNIRESGNVEQDADIIIMLYRKDYYDSDDDKDKNNNNNNFGSGEGEKEQSDLSTVEAIVRKNRNGRTGSVKFVFDKTISAFDALLEDDNNKQL